MGWVTQREYHFSFHGIIDELEKICYVVLYMNSEHWKWWKWCKNACKGYVARTLFVAYIYKHFDIETHYLGHLTKLKQPDKVEDFITTFKQIGLHNVGNNICLLHGIPYQWPKG